MPHLSASQLDTFLQCSKKWVAQYIDQLHGDPSEALGLGSALHEVLENFGRWRMQRKSGTIDTEAMKREFTQTLRRTLAQQDPAGVLIKAWDTMEAKGHAIIEGFCTHIAPIYWPISVEQPFEFKIPEMEPYNGEDWTMVGRIDARTLLGSGDICTVDWKTGKKWREGAEHGKVQATAYVLADLMMGKPVPAQVTFITFPVDWNAKEQRFICEPDIRVTQRTLKQVSDLVQTLRTTALQINRLRDSGGVNAPPHPSYLCPWCPRYSRCFAGQSFMYEKGRLPAVTVDENDEPLSLLELAEKSDDDALAS